MKPVYWTTEEPHADNYETMRVYLENYCTLKILYVDGTYAEGENENGERFEMHAGGNGDPYNHVITFVKMVD